MSEDHDSGDDDWFERALAEDADGETSAATAEEQASAEADEQPLPSDAEPTDGGGDPFASETDDASGFPTDETGDADPFSTDTETAGDPFGADADQGGSDGGVFGEDFASAFDAGGDGGEFDDEDYQTDIPRLDLGIAGLDEMIQGGVPRRHLMVAIGSAGTGKTTFGLQYLHHGLQVGENGVFITLEQSHQAILDTAAEWGWDFEAYEEADELAIVDLDPVEMANSLDNIRSELPELIEDFDADRLVLDSVSLLEMMYENQAQRRTEVYDFTRSLKKAGVTTFLTSEASETNPYASRHGIIEYLTDAVIVLKYVRSESRETRLAVEIVKIRNANHSREMKPYDITEDGISVYQQANIF